MNGDRVIHVHLYDSLITREGHRVTRPEISGPVTVGSLLPADVPDWVIMMAGEAIDPETIVEPGSVIHAAPRSGDPGMIVMIGLAVFSAVASMLLAPKVKAPRIGAEKNQEQRFGFGRFSSDAAVGDTIPVPFGRVPRYGGKIVSKVPGDGADGDQRVRILITFGYGGEHGINAIGNQTADFDGVAGEDLTGVYLNDQPVANFMGVKAWGRLGTPDQDVIPGFADTEVLREIGTGDGIVLRNTSGTDRTDPSPSGEAYAYSTVAAVNAITLRIRLDEGLYTISGTGQIDPRTVRYRYRTRTSDTGSGAGSWSAWSSITLSKAEQSQFYSSPRIDLTTDEDGECYDVEVERVSLESSSAADRDRMVWDAVKEITYAENTYPGMALLALEIVAGEQLTGIPSVSTDIEGLKVRVWDGVSDPLDPEWEIAFSSNPAYVAMELLTNDEWGMNAEGLGWSVVASDVVSWAEYCDELVDLSDGSGQIPRFAFNAVLEDPRSGLDWLRTICAAGECTPATFGKAWRFVVDRPQESPVEVITDASILTDEDGYPIIVYERETGTDGHVRPNQLICEFANELMAGEPDAITYPEDGTLWLGEETRNPQTMKLEGVTHPDQVMRHLRRSMKRIRFLERTVKLQTTLPLLQVQPGERFDLACSVMGWGLISGRVRAGSAPTTIILDKELTLADATTYVVRVVHADGGIEVKTITSAAGFYAAGASIAVASAWTTIPARWAEYVVGEMGVETKPFLCQRVSVAESDRLIWELEGIEYDDDVYDDTLDEVTFPEYSTLNTGRTPPGPLLTLTAYERVFQDRRQIQLAWTQSSADAEISGSYRIYRRRTGTTTWVLSPVANVAKRGAVLDVDQTDVAYDFVVVAVSIQGVYLSPFDPRHPIASVVFGLESLPPPPPEDLIATQTGGNTYALSWSPVDGATSYVVLTGGSPGTGLPNDGAEDCLILARVDVNSLEGLELAPGQSVTFWVRSVGSNGRMSFTASAVTVASPAIPIGQAIKETQVFDIEDGGTLTNLTWDATDARLELTSAASPGVYLSPAIDTGSSTACELTCRLLTANDAADPTIAEFGVQIPSIEADQWGVIDDDPDPVIGMLMPPYPDASQSWLVEVRTYDGTLWSDWEILDVCASINRTFEQYQFRVTMARTRSPYRPALRGLTAVLTH